MDQLAQIAKAAEVVQDVPVSQITQIVNYLTSIFNPEEVFASLTSFIGSGYLFIIIAGFIIYGIVKKVMNLVLFAAIAFGVWFICTSGIADQILAQITSLF